jgi:hypothetical protein
MDYSICSRETERDYTWDNTHASHPVEEYARGFFAPAFEGSMTTSRFAALLRCPGSPDGVMLCISVSTPRRDFRHRPIRTMAFLRAETEQETDLLSAFFAECLRTETLDDEESPLARAVESIYQTKGLEEFTRFCQSLPQMERHKGVPPTGRYELPRNGTADRQALSESLSAFVEGDKPFLAVLTDREPSAVLESLGSLFDHGTVRIFSKEVSEKKKLPEKGGPKKYWIGGGLGITAALCGILLAVHTYSGHVATSGGGSGDGERGPAKDSVLVAPSTPQDGGDLGQLVPAGGVILSASQNPPEAPMVPVATPKPGDGEGSIPETDAGILEKEEMPNAADGAARDTEPSEKVSSGNREDVENDCGEGRENTVPPPSVTQAAVEIAPDALKPVKMPTGPAVDPKPDTAESEVPGD